MAATECAGALLKAQLFAKFIDEAGLIPLQE
jgi:hypothetical protein